MSRQAAAGYAIAAVIWAAVALSLAFPARHGDPAGRLRHPSLEVVWCAQARCACWR